MRLSFKAMALALAILLGLTIAVPHGFAQDSRPPAGPQDIAAKERAARDLIVEALPASRAPEIYEDLRGTVREVYLPVLRDAASGNVPGMPAPDAKMADVMAKLLTFLTYALKASDEADASAKANRDAIIADVAALLARHASAAEINNARELLRMTAARKGFDTVYAASRLATGFTYEETRSMQEFSAWANRLGQGFSGATPPGNGGVPSAEKIAKAQAIVNDLLRISRIDDMVADTIRFLREVPLKVAPVTEEERAEYSAQLDQYEFMYTMQKGVLIAAAPAVLAAVLNEEQLAKLHDFVRSPACAKMFLLFYDVVRAAATFTAPDIQAVQDFAAKANANGELTPRGPEEEALAEAEWEALRKKWSDRLMESVSPETREGLERSMKDLQSLDVPAVPGMPEKPL